MDEIEDVVQDICQACAGRGQRVPAVLAAYIARVILEANPAQFSPDAELSADDVDELIRLAIARLCETDAPALETIKMQVAFDSTYVRFEEELDAAKKARDDKKRELVHAILAVKPRGSTDFETLTALYRQIFTYLLHVSRGGGGLPGLGGAASASVATSDDPASVERTAEREIAAALESVFPRIGLKTFVQLSAEEKRAQCEELARIVTGIRLFNREGGKGGAGLEHVEDVVATTLSDLREALETEISEQHELALRYQETLVYCHLRRATNVAPSQLLRWNQELANRRQYSAYLTSLAEDAAASARRVSAHRERFATEMDELQALVGGRASVPKEHVYPKFDAIASAWFALDDELRAVESRVATLEELHQFRESYVMTLGPNNATYRAASLEQRARPALFDGDEDEDEDEQRAHAERDDDDARADEQDEERRRRHGGDGETAHGDTEHHEQHSSEPTHVEGGEGVDRPVRLSVETTPEFMQLPLEYQGFCGWTVANRRGLLLPGKPALGVVRWRGSCFVFAHAVAMRAFMQRPDAVRAGVLSAASDAPELVHLLRLQDQYPGTSIAKLLAARSAKLHHHTNGGPGGGQLEATAGNNSGAAAALLAPPATRDAGTETPTHFTEKHMDPSYEWNDWALRRRALRMAQLKHCATTSQQTDASHFKRANATQVFLPRIASTQTRKDASCNPPVRVQYLQGLRGGPAQKHAKVNLTFELGDL